MNTLARFGSEFVGQEPGLPCALVSLEEVILNSVGHLKRTV